MCACTFCLSILLLLDTWTAPILSTMNNAAMNMGIQTSPFVPVFNSEWHICNSGIAGLYCNSMFKFLRDQNLFSTAATPFYIPSSNVQEFYFSISLPTFVISSVFVFVFTTAILMGIKWYSIVVLICIMLRMMLDSFSFAYLWRNVYSSPLPSF